MTSSSLPLVLPLMIPSRHLMEKENILFFPPAGRLPFLTESVWGMVKERCLGARRPFPNTTLADMFIFWPVMRKQPHTSSSWHFHHLADLVVSSLPWCLHVLLPLWRTSSPLRWVFPRSAGNRCRLFFFFLREEGFRSNTEPPRPPPYKKTIVNSIPWGLRRQKLTGGKKCSVFASLAWSVLQEQMAAGSGLWGTACLPECNGNILCRKPSLNIAKQYAMWAPIQGGSF